MARPCRRVCGSWLRWLFGVASPSLTMRECLLCLSSCEWFDEMIEELKDVWH